MITYSNQIDVKEYKYGERKEGALLSLYGKT